MGFIALFASGVAAGAFSLGYKMAGKAGYRVAPLLFVFSLVNAAVSLAASLILKQPIGDLLTILLGLATGVCMLFAVMLYFIVLRSEKHNVSWTIIQFSVLIPFTAGIVLYGETPSFRAVTGTVSILFALVLFGIGKNRQKGKPGSVSPSAEDTLAKTRTAFLLFLSTVLSGAAQVTALVFVAERPGAGVFPLLFASGVGMGLVALPWMIRSAAVSGAGRFGPGALGVAAYMGVLNTAAYVLLLFALVSVESTIAFPLRNAVNIVSVFIFSFLLFRERATPFELAGAAVSVVGIALVSGA